MPAGETLQGQSNVNPLSEINTRIEGVGLTGRAYSMDTTRGLGYFATLARNVIIDETESITLFDHPEFQEMGRTLLDLERQERIHGGTSETAEKRYRIIAELNRLGLRCLGTSLTDLSQADKVDFKGQPIQAIKNPGELFPIKPVVASKIRLEDQSVQIEPLTEVEILWGRDIGYNGETAIKQLGRLLEQYGGKLPPGVLAERKAQLGELQKLIQDDRLFGSTSDNRAAQSRIILEINSFLLTWLGGSASFVDFATKEVGGKKPQVQVATVHRQDVATQASPAVEEIVYLEDQLDLRRGLDELRRLARSEYAVFEARITESLAAMEQYTISPTQVSTLLQALSSLDNVMVGRGEKTMTEMCLGDIGTLQPQNVRDNLVLEMHYRAINNALRAATTRRQDTSSLRQALDIYSQEMRKRRLI